MTSYTIVGFDTETWTAPVPTKVESYWSREGRYFITILTDENGYEMDSATDGTKADRDCSVRSFQRRIAAGE